RLVGARDTTVLIVEDAPDVLGTAAAMLRSLGYSVVEAADGPAALAALQEGSRIDVLFPDVILPRGRAGHHLAPPAAAHRPQLKIIYTSGYDESVIVHEGVVDEGVTLLRKPYTKEILLAAIEKIMPNDVASAVRRPA